MYFVIDAQLAKQRHEEMIREAEHERRFAHLHTTQVNPLANAINALKGVFGRRESSRQSAAGRALTAE